MISNERDLRPLSITETTVLANILGQLKQDIRGAQVKVKITFFATNKQLNVRVKRCYDGMTVCTIYKNIAKPLARAVINRYEQAVYEECE